MSKMSPANLIILTMRSQFYHHARSGLRSQYTRTYSVMPFSPTDVFTFLTNWPYSRDGDIQARRIFEQLADNTTVRDLCRNPLVLSMYVAHDQSSEVNRAIPPASRTEFYRSVTDELLVYRRAAQPGTMRVSVADRKSRLLILGRCAYEHLMDEAQPCNQLHMRSAITVIAQVKHQKSKEAEETFREIAKETGLIIEERFGETYRFI